MSGRLGTKEETKYFVYIPHPLFCRYYFSKLVVVSPSLSPPLSFKAVALPHWQFAAKKWELRGKSRGNFVYSATLL